MSSKPSAAQTPMKSGGTTPRKSGTTTPARGGARCGPLCKFLHSKLFLVILLVLNVAAAFLAFVAIKKDYKLKRVVTTVVALLSAVSMFFLFKRAKAKAD